MKRSREAIACPCWILRHSAHSISALGYHVAIPVPTNMLLMDHYNHCIKNVSDFASHVDTNNHYITTHGRVVSGREAFLIALHANQLRDEQAINGKLDPLDIWPRN